MKDLKLTSAGDLDISSFDLQLVDGAEQVGQRLQIALRTFLGEWFLDTAAGVPWFEEILGIKPANLNRIEAIIRETILTRPEVLSLESFTIDYNGATRQLQIDFKALTEVGVVSASIIAPPGV